MSTPRGSSGAPTFLDEHRRQGVSPATPTLAATPSRRCGCAGKALGLPTTLLIDTRRLRGRRRGGAGRLGVARRAGGGEDVAGGLGQVGIERVQSLRWQKLSAAAIARYAEFG